jgi:hypothetical protein
VRSRSKIVWRRSACSLVVLLIATFSVVAVDASPAVADAAAWSAPQAINHTGFAENLVNLSCASQSFCVTSDEFGHSFVYDGTGWSAQPIATFTDSISCPTVGFCLGITVAGEASTYNGTSWSAEQKFAVNESEGLGGAAVSCASPSFCDATDTTGGVYTYNGSTWSPPTSVLAEHGELASISCPSANFCATVQGGNSVGVVIKQAYTYNNGVWTPEFNAQTFPQERVSYTSVSCPSASFCMAVDEAGKAISTTTEHWEVDSPIVSVDPEGGGLKSVSCASSTFCMAVDHDGNALSYSQFGWGQPQKIDSSPLEEVSCPSATFCVATDAAGNVLLYEPPPANTAPPAISGTAQVGTTTAAAEVVDAAQVKAALAAIPLPTGEGAKVAKLLKHGDYAAGFTAPSAGTLTIDWYAKPKPKANTKATRKIKAVKKILIAQGKITVATPGATQVKVSFTKLGAKLLKSSKAVKVTDKSTFTPVGSPPTSLTSTFTLKR